MRIRVATLNVWGLPGPLTPSLDARMQAIGERLAGLELDAIAFQEVWSDDARKRLVAAGRKAGLANIWHSAGTFGGGLLVLARLPIRSASFTPFSLRGDPGRPDHPDYYGGKGWVTVELETRVGPLSFIDTHLHARYANDVSHAYRAHRVGQIVELALASRALVHPVVAAGDLNFTDGDPEHAILMGLAGLRDLAAELDTPAPTVLRANPYRAHSAKPDRRIDYVLARDGGGTAVIPLRTRRVFDEPFEIDGNVASFSNHAGVLADLELVPGAGRALPPPSPHSVSLATQILREGRRETKQRRRGDRTWAGVGLSAAALASLGVRDPRVSRRRLLRTALQVGTLLALTPGVGFSIVSELLTPEELRAFDLLAVRLARFRSEPPADAST